MGFGLSIPLGGIAEGGLNVLEEEQQGKSLSIKFCFSLALPKGVLGFI